MTNNFCISEKPPDFCQKEVKLQLFMTKWNGSVLSFGLKTQICLFSYLLPFQRCSHNILAANTGSALRDDRIKNALIKFVYVVSVSDTDIFDVV